jgi:hypothetical protein
MRVLIHFAVEETHLKVQIKLVRSAAALSTLANAELRPVR